MSPKKIGDESRKIPADKEHSLPKKVKKDLEDTIISLYLSGDAVSIAQADDICEKNYINREQYLKYLNPDAEKNEELIQTIPMPKAVQESQIILVKSPINQMVPLYESFPYGYQDIVKIKNPQKGDFDFVAAIAQGIINVYLSKDILRVLNQKELLGKLSQISTLKKEKTLIHNLKQQLDDDEYINTIFLRTFEYLDNYAYRHFEWEKKASSLHNRYSAAKNEQRIRTGHIPLAEKEKFIDSIINVPLKPLSDYFKADIDNSLKTKQLLADFIIINLEKAWNYSINPEQKIIL